jgi:hypothetical protein
VTYPDVLPDVQVFDGIDVFLCEFDRHVVATIALSRCVIPLVHQKQQFRHLHIKSQSVFGEASSHSTASEKSRIIFIIFTIFDSTTMAETELVRDARCPGGDNREGLFT